MMEKYCIHPNINLFFSLLCKSTKKSQNDNSFKKVYKEGNTFHQLKQLSHCWEKGSKGENCIAINTQRFWHQFSPYLLFSNYTTCANCVIIVLAAMISYVATISES